MAARRRNEAPAQSRALVSRKDAIESVRDLLNQYKPQMELALPKHLSADRMARLFMTCIANEPKLLECTKKSLVGSVIQLSQLGLEPGLLGHAYLIPFRNHGTMECQVIPGYKGLLKLARNSGMILNVQANVVYAQDEFDFELGLNPILKHRPTTEAVTPDDMIYAYAIVGIKGAPEPQWDVMNRREILDVRKSSRAGDSGPWVTHPAEMWKKTVLRRICKLLPSSIELQNAIAIDEAVDAGLPSLDFIDIDALDDVSEGVDQSEGTNA